MFDLSPISFIIDVDLCKALSVFTHDGASTHAIDATTINRLPRHLRSRLEGVLTANLDRPSQERSRRKGSSTSPRRLYFRHVASSHVRFRVTVTMTHDGAKDPISELLQLYDSQLLAFSLPSWARALLPLVSNLAHISDATFTVNAYRADSEFASTSEIVSTVAAHYKSRAQQLLASEMIMVSSCALHGVAGLRPARSPRPTVHGLGPTDRLTAYLASGGRVARPHRQPHRAVQAPARYKV